MAGVLNLITESFLQEEWRLGQIKQTQIVSQPEQIDLLIRLSLQSDLAKDESTWKPS